MARVRNQSRSAILAEHVDVASRLADRLRGLLGRTGLPAGHGLWISGCNSIHTFFMRFPIDAVFVSRDGRVLKTYENLKPNRLTRVVFGARSVLELPAGTIRAQAVTPGDELRLETAS